MKTEEVYCDYAQRTASCLTVCQNRATRFFRSDGDFFTAKVGRLLAPKPLKARCDDHAEVWTDEYTREISLDEFLVAQVMDA